MPEYLSDEWFTSAAAALDDDATLQEASRGVQLVFEQRVTPPGAADTPGIEWHVVLDDGRVSLHRGPAADPTVTFSCDRDTAIAIQCGATSAQAAFMDGRMRLGGDVAALLAHQHLFSGLDDVLGPLRSATTG